MRLEERRYYDLLAPEYDDWALVQGRYARLEPPGWRAELHRVLALLSRLAPGRILDAGCGTGIFTSALRGDVLGVDQSSAMLEIARKRCPGARFVLGDALELPFEDGSFDLVFSSHFYGHLRPKERARFLRQAGRVADSLVVVENALRPRLRRETVQRRALSDGSRHRIYKRFFTASDLAAELEAGVLFEGEWFVAAANGRATDLVT